MDFKKNNFSTGAVAISDIDLDGDLDIFIGQRLHPFEYGIPGSGYIYLNDGEANFKNGSGKNLIGGENLGMITDAIFEDLDNDGFNELIVVGEFMGVEIFKNKNGVLSKIEDNPLSEIKGWWNVIFAEDFNGDGLKDIIVGNHGTNSRFKASDKRPISLYINDYDKNGSKDPILTFRAENNKDYPYSLRHDLINQIKILKKQFPNYDSFKDASMKDIFSENQINNSYIPIVNNLRTTLLINQGDMNFNSAYLPKEVQFSPILGINAKDFDKDGDLDLVMGGNLFGVKPEMGRYDSSYGVFLENLGDAKFKFHSDGKGLIVKGEIRKIISDEDLLIISRNNNNVVIYEY